MTTNMKSNDPATQEEQEAKRKPPLTRPQPGYWLELERIETPNAAHDKIVMIAVSAITGERHVIGAI